jgi:outer membrane protein
MASQKSSYQDAAKLMQIAVRRFSLNEATILEVKEAQQSFETVGYSYVNLHYAAKIAEVKLKD